MHLLKFYYDSPLDTLDVIVENNMLVSLKPCNMKKETTLKSEFLLKIKTQLDKYFAGELKNFDIPINPIGTEFQKLVWCELLKIPYGETKSYIEIAQAIGKPNAQRAVGQACNKNPILIIIPCHRVIAKNGKLNGFAYKLSIKKELLDIEFSSRS